MAIAFDEFFNAYVSCALWASTDDNGEPMDIYTIDDIEGDTVAQMRTDCANFLDLAGGWIGDQASDAGHDFWLTRNRHGAGFWDRGNLYGSDGKGRKLTDLAHSFGEACLLIGDEGLIFQA